MSVYVNTQLAWSSHLEENQVLRKVALIALPLFLVLSVVITLIQLPEREREEVEALPPQLAKIILAKKVPPPAPPEPKVEPKPVEKPPEPKVAQKPKVEKKPEVVKPAVAKKPKVERKPEDIAKAKERAEKSGLLAMKSQLSALSSLADSVKLETAKTITAKPITRKKTDVLAANASSASVSGIDETQLVQSAETMTLASRSVSQVEAPASAEESAAVAENEAGQIQLAGRTQEELVRTMDKHKAAIQNIYNRERRRKPSLQGVIVPRLVVETDGSVSSCEIVESSMDLPSFEQKICKRLLLVNFGPKPDATQIPFDYTLRMFPG